MSDRSRAHAIDAAVLALAGRDRLAFDMATLRSLVEGRSTAVTGAGGSIGSALARMLVHLGAEKLLLIDLSEHDLFMLERTLAHTRSPTRVVTHLGDAGDSDAIGNELASLTTEIVFHAAAYKHAPMLERFPVAAVANNVLVSSGLADTARAAGVRRLVSVSTDKAVDPVGVMGATKRAVERLFAGTPETESSVVSVRFGNVVGSRGSAVPLFAAAVAERRRIEITDEAASRLFLAESEAVELLVSSVALGCHGDVLVPELGRPVRIVDLAYAVATAAGVGASSVDLEVVGLRLGERLAESLVGKSERTESTEHQSVSRIVGEAPPTRAEIDSWLSRCREAVRLRDAGRCLALLNEMVPEFTGGGLECEPERTR